MSRQQQFIEAIAPKAQEIQRKYGVPASIAIAQAALETGWGDKVKGNNLFGIKAGKTWAGASIDVATHEYLDGVRTGITDKFRSYDCVEDSLENYGWTLANKCRYKKVIGADAFTAADELQRARYATDPIYSDKLKSIISKYNLTRFDDESYRGYTDGERFAQTRLRLNQRIDGGSTPFHELLESFADLLKNLASGFAALIFNGTAQEASAPAATPSTSRVAAVGIPPRA